MNMGKALDDGVGVAGAGSILREGNGLEDALIEFDGHAGTGNWGSGYPVTALSGIPLVSRKAYVSAREPLIGLVILH